MFKYSKKHLYKNIVKNDITEKKTINENNK